MFSRSSVWVISAAMLAGVIGCGPKVGTLKTVPVEGKVTHNGQPVEGATVTFFPADPSSGKAAGGTTDATGKFSLQTLEGGTKMAKGAMVGEYKVSVAKTSTTGAAMPTYDPSKGVTPDQKVEMPDVPKLDASGTPKGAEGSGGDTGLKSQLPAKYEN